MPIAPVSPCGSIGYTATLLRVAARIACEQAGLVGQNHQCVGLDQVGDQRSEGVVVAEPDLLGRDRVVLVDDRDGIELQQGAQRRARVEVPLAIGEVFVREQDLGGVQAMRAKAGLVGLHQAHLTDRRRGLLLVELARTPPPA